MKNNQIGLYFGSFNPFHNGHLAIAKYMYEKGIVGEVWFVLSPHNPLKQEADLLDCFSRLEMLEAAIAPYPFLKASSVEFDLPRPSYTYDTLQEIKKQYPKNTFSLILGADAMENFHLWKNYKAILENYSIYLYPRNGKQSIPKANNITLLDAPLLDVSSSMVRKKVKNNESVANLLPDAALRIIKERRFYQ